MLDMLALMKRVMLRMLHVKMASACSTWRSQVAKIRAAEQAHIASTLQRQQLQRSVQLMDRVLRRLQRAQLGKGYKKWSMIVDKHKQGLSEKERKLQLMIRVFNRMMQAQLFRGFNHWWTLLRAEKRAQERALQITVKIV